MHCHLTLLPTLPSLFNIVHATILPAFSPQSCITLSPCSLSQLSQGTVSCQNLSLCCPPCNLMLFPPKVTHSHLLPPSCANISCTILSSTPILHHHLSLKYLFTCFVLPSHTIISLCHLPLQCFSTIFSKVSHFCLSSLSLSLQSFSVVSLFFLSWPSSVSKCHYGYFPPVGRWLWQLWHWQICLSFSLVHLQILQDVGRKSNRKTHGKNNSIPTNKPTL